MVGEEINGREMRDKRDLRGRCKSKDINGRWETKEL